MLTKREVIHQVLNHQPAPYVPWSLSFTLEAYEKLQAYYGREDLNPILDNHLLELGNGIGFFTDMGEDHVQDVFGHIHF